MEDIYSTTHVDENQPSPSNWKLGPDGRLWSLSDEWEIVVVEPCVSANQKASQELVAHSVTEYGCHCGICFQKTDSSQELIKLHPCCHVFHWKKNDNEDDTCFVEYIQAEFLQPREFTCPTCKNPVSDSLWYNENGNWLVSTEFDEL